LAHKAASAKSIAACTCIAEKGAWWAAVWPQLKVRLMCKAGHASNSTPPPQRRKINCSLQNALVENPLKNLRGGLRCGKRGWHLKPQLHHLLRLPHHRKIKQIALAQKFAWWAAM